MSEPPILLKWPGGKRALLKYLLPLAPKRFNHYYEPFVGGGALFFALHPQQATLADSNEELITCYTQVRDQPAAVIAYLSKWKNTEADYYAIREYIPSEDVEKAARLIYLMSLSFNGLHRVNAQGKFNTPYGYNERAEFCNVERILAASTSLSSARLIPGDFELATEDAKQDDFIYFDPPYTVAHNHNGFLEYNATIFSWKDQQRLAERAVELSQRGCTVLVSNADHQTIRDLYPHFKARRVRRTSAMAASSKYRRPITEFIFYSRR